MRSLIAWLLDTTASLASLALDHLAKGTEPGGLDEEAETWAPDADDPSDTPVFNGLAAQRFREQLHDEDALRAWLAGWTP